jgi:dTDP-4-amino-4,6-dideoxygalactose transaminase
MGTISFHETKNITAGEGGALILNREKIEECFDLAHFIREKGTNRVLFDKGEVDKYTWVANGSNYLTSELNAALLCGQIENLREVQDMRKKLWLDYCYKLSDWANSSNVTIPNLEHFEDSNYHMFYLIFENNSIRNKFITFMNQNDIITPFHYQALDESKMAKNQKFRETNCEVSKSISTCLVRLPLFASLTRTQQEKVINTVLEFKFKS